VKVTLPEGLNARGRERWAIKKAKELRDRKRDLEERRATRKPETCWSSWPTPTGPKDACCRGSRTTRRRTRRSDYGMRLWRLGANPRLTVIH